MYMHSIYVLCTYMYPMCMLIQDVCPEVTNPEQDPVACQPDAMQGHIYDVMLELSMYVPISHSVHWLSVWP